MSVLLGSVTGQASAARVKPPFAEGSTGVKLGD
jgi:hypothetical protein